MSEDIASERGWDHRPSLRDLSREVTVSIQQVGRHGWQGTVMFGPCAQYVYALTRKGCERKARREVEREARLQAWRDASVTQVIGMGGP